MDERKLFDGASIRPPDVSHRTERPKTGGETKPIVVNVGTGPVTNPPKRDSSQTK